MPEPRIRSDICMVLEGTWPYIAGGVSTWVQQIFEANPNLNFSVFFIGAKSEERRRVKYTIPKNVVEIKHAFLHDPVVHPKRTGLRSTLSKNRWQAIDRTMEAIRLGKAIPLGELQSLAGEVDNREHLYRELTSTKASWKIIRECYERTNDDRASFLDFFWTWRFTALPLFGLLLNRLPDARLYHSASTGYAGLIAAHEALRTGRPYLLTEHGLYSRERRIEITNAEWIADTGVDANDKGLPRPGLFKRWWTSFFDAITANAYDAADRITTLFDANRQHQIRGGADPQKCSIIVNGINVSRFDDVEVVPRRDGEPWRIGFVGRITAIKDIKTLLQALATVAEHSHDFVCDLLGPVDEEPEYYQECRDLTASLGLSQRVNYRGRVDISQWLGKFDILVLSSISEGLPFVILEAQAVGMPVVSTEVGACRELLEGGRPEDRAVGKGGLISRVGHPQEFAERLETLMNNPDLAQEMAQNGKKRVRQFFDIRDVMGQYRQLYDDMLQEHHERGMRRRTTISLQGLKAP